MSSSRSRMGAATARVAVAALDDTSTFADRAYTALRDVIVSLNVYDEPGDVRLDERQIANDLGISRTPVREAMAQLEREGFVTSQWRATENNRRAKYYELTRRGRAQLETQTEAWRKLTTTIGRVLETN